MSNDEEDAENEVEDEEGQEGGDEEKVSISVGRLYSLGEKEKDTNRELDVSSDKVDADNEGEERRGGKVIRIRYVNYCKLRAVVICERESS